MSLTFEYILNTSEGSIEPSLTEQNFITNEPNGDILNYFVKNYMAKEKVQKYEPITEYDKISFTKITTRLTTNSVSKIGIKAFPRIGSYGFYKDKYTGLSTIVCPINTAKIKHKAPTLKFSYSGSRCHFEIKPPLGSNYECYRIVFSNGDFSEEYITYETTYDCDAPRILGTYEVYCIGYVEKEQKVSSKSNEFSYTVTSGSTVPGPGSTESYYSKYQIDEMFNNLGEVYTKQEIDAMIGKIDSLLDKLNGTVV